METRVSIRIERKVLPIISSGYDVWNIGIVFQIASNAKFFPTCRDTANGKRATVSIRLKREIPVNPVRALTNNPVVIVSIRITRSAIQLIHNPFCAMAPRVSIRLQREVLFNCEDIDGNPING